MDLIMSNLSYFILFTYTTWMNIRTVAFEKHIVAFKKYKVISSLRIEQLQWHCFRRRLKADFWWLSFVTLFFGKNCLQLSQIIDRIPPCKYIDVVHLF